MACGTTSEGIRCGRARMRRYLTMLILVILLLYPMRVLLLSQAVLLMRKAPRKQYQLMVEIITIR